MWLAIKHWFFLRLTRCRFLPYEWRLHSLRRAVKESYREFERDRRSF